MTDPDWISIMIGASAAEMRISTKVEAINADAPPEPRRVGPSNEGEDEAEEFRRQQDADREAEQLQRALVVEPRPGRKQREVGGEIFRPDVVRLQHEHDADQQLRHPERRGEIAHDPGREMLARRPAQSPWRR